MSGSEDDYIVYQCNKLCNKCSNLHVCETLEKFQHREEAPTRAFCLLKAPKSAFRMKNLL